MIEVPEGRAAVVEGTIIIVWEGVPETVVCMQWQNNIVKSAAIVTALT